MKAVITVLGRDRVGIIAGVSRLLAEHGINILDISQTIMQDIFTMVMLVDTSMSSGSIAEVSRALDTLGAELGVQITIQHEAVFGSMHRV